MTKREVDPRLAARLREVRTKLRLDQKDMAPMLGMSLRGYKYAEGGEATLHAKALLLALKAIEAGLEP